MNQILAESATMQPASPAAPTVQTKASALYVYGIVRADASIPTELLGLFDAPVRLHAKEALAAIVSNAQATKLRPERRHLAAHQRVLATVAHVADVLPMSFGTVPGRAATVERMLIESAGAFEEELSRIAGRSEMTLRLSLNVPNVFQYFVESDAELRSARDRMLRDPAHENKVAVGRLFTHALEAARASASERILAVLSTNTVEQHVNTPRTEPELFNASFLVDRARLGEYDESIARIAALFDDAYTLDVSGPWPPHSFVDLRL